MTKMRRFIVAVASSATALLPFLIRARDRDGVGGWLHDQRLTDFRLLFLAGLVALLWAMRPNRSVIRSVLLGVLAGYVAGLVASEAVYFQAGYAYRPMLPSMRNRPWYELFVPHLVLMQMVPPNFLAGALAGLVQWMLARPKTEPAP